MWYLLPGQMTIRKPYLKGPNERDDRGTTDLKNNNMFGHQIKLEDKLLKWIRHTVYL